MEGRVERGEGGLLLGGVLDFASVPALWPRLSALLCEAEGEVVLSLAGVEGANSAALALLLEALALAGERGLTLRLEAVPENLRELAGLSGVLDLLGLD